MLAEQRAVNIRLTVVSTAGWWVTDTGGSLLAVEYLHYLCQKKEGHTTTGTLSND
jgi:hypothetical protein